MSRMHRVAGVHVQDEDLMTTKNGLHCSLSRAGFAGHAGFEGFPSVTATSMLVVGAPIFAPTRM